MRPLEAERIRAKVRSRLFRTPETPVQIDRYVLEARVGEGGMGTVYRARDPQLMRDVAVKLLEPVHAEDRLLEEARAMAKLEHPNVLAIHDLGTFEGQVFLVMKYVDGQNLARWLDATPPPREVARVFADAARGLAALHRAGIVHRDFKPENVLIDRRGHVVVADFGLARDAPDATAAVTGATPHTQVAGTPAYMAPELLDGKRATVRSDVFAFCVALHEALHGVRPFQGRNVLELRAAHERPPVRGTRAVPAWLGRIAARGLAADPAARWGSVDELITPLVSGPSRVPALAAGLAAVALAGAVYALWPAEVVAPPPPKLGRTFVDVYDEAQVAVHSAPLRECYDGPFAVSVGFAGSGEVREADANIYSGFSPPWTEAQRNCVVKKLRALHISPFDSQPPDVHTLRVRFVEDEDGRAPYVAPSFAAAATTQPFDSGAAREAVLAASYAGCGVGAFSLALRFTEGGQVLEAKLSARDLTAEQRECVLKVARAVRVPAFNRRFATDDALNVQVPARP